MKNKKWLLLIIPAVAIHFFLTWRYYTSNKDTASGDLFGEHASNNSFESYLYENGEHREEVEGYHEYYVTKKYMCTDDDDTNYYVTSTIGYIKSSKYYRATSICTFDKKIVKNYEKWKVTSSFVMELNNTSEAMMTSKVECTNNKGKNYYADVHFGSMVFYTCPSIELEKGKVTKENFPASTVKNEKLIELADTCMRLTTLCGQETMSRLTNYENTLW